MKEIEVPIKTPIIDELQDIVFDAGLNFKNDSRQVDNLKMSILMPRDTKLHPAILYFPGGGFTKADYHKFIDLRIKLAQAGFVVAAAQYRVIPNTFPTIVSDGKAALRFLRAHAMEFRIDSSRIGVLGDSAGGYLAQMLGVTQHVSEFSVGENLDQPESVQAVVSLYGISDLLTIGTDYDKIVEDNHHTAASPEAILLNGVAFNEHLSKTIDDNQQLAKKASPINYVRSGLEPFLLMYGTSDNIVSPSQSQKIAQALIDSQNDAELISLKDAGHGTAEWHQEQILQMITNWLVEKLHVTADAAVNSGVDL